MGLSVGKAALVIRRVIGAFALAMSGVLCAGQIASGQSDGPDGHGITHPSIATSLPARGDPAGLRQWLAHHGVAYNLLYVSDVLSNLRGGLRRGTIAQGKLEGSLYLDFEKLAGRTGLSLFANFFQIHNTGRIRRDYVGGINTVSAIEAVPTTRLSELWFEQKFAGNAASLRVGQLTADSEFFVSDMTGMFLQSDWPTIAAANLPSGGSAYPLSTPGVRLKVNPTEDVSLLLGIFNGDPAGPGDGDEQVRNRHGLNFRVHDPAFVIGEAQFRRNQGKSDPGLATTFRIGGWGHLGGFEDRRFTAEGGLIADPAGSGEARLHRGNSGFYALVDQQVYRPSGGDAQSGISVFSRVSFSPSDRNTISFFLDGGVIFAGLIPGRPDDKFGVSAMHARFSNGVRGFDRDTIVFAGAPGVIRDYETSLELTYAAQVIPGWTVQPVIQRIWHPSGDASRNATVTGARSVWRF